MIFRIGQGYDIHRLIEGRPLILGGITIDYEKGLLGHSDADALLHAITDALLGAAGLGDIGRHFPDTDPATAKFYCPMRSVLWLKPVGQSSMWMLRSLHKRLNLLPIWKPFENPLPRQSALIFNA